MEIVINTCFGGFALSRQVYKELGIEWDGYGYPDNSTFDIDSSNYEAYRSNPKLIDAIKKIGLKESSGNLSSLKIVSVPDDLLWEINEYDGMESVRQSHQSWS